MVLMEKKEDYVSQQRSLDPHLKLSTPTSRFDDFDVSNGGGRVENASIFMKGRSKGQSIAQNIRLIPFPRNMVRVPMGAPGAYNNQLTVFPINGREVRITTPLPVLDEYGGIAGNYQPGINIEEYYNSKGKGNIEEYYNSKGKGNIEEYYNSKGLSCIWNKDRRGYIREIDEERASIVEQILRLDARLVELNQRESILQNEIDSIPEFIPQNCVDFSENQQNIGVDKNALTKKEECPEQEFKESDEMNEFLANLLHDAWSKEEQAYVTDVTGTSTLMQDSANEFLRALK